jgi:hypothetical protein
MSTYNGRRGPNVSQYLRDLNTISPQDTTGDDSFNMEENLSFFTNTQFFDLDSGQNTDFQAPPVKPDAVATPAPSSTEDPASVMGDISNMDFINGESILSLVLSRLCSHADAFYSVPLKRRHRNNRPQSHSGHTPSIPSQPDSLTERSQPHAHCTLLLLLP